MSINCSVTVMPVSPDNAIGFILRDKADTFAGLLIAPGGKIEMTDGEVIDGVLYHSVETAAVREILEETGVLLDREQLKYFCSLTLPNGRVVISLYAHISEKQTDEMAQNCVKFYTSDAVTLMAEFFAPGMVDEANMLWTQLAVLAPSWRSVKTSEHS